jgi:hypothetical protein
MRITPPNRPIGLDALGRRSIHRRPCLGCANRLYQVKAWHIAAERQTDTNRTPIDASLIVTVEHGAQSASLHPDDRIGLRVERGVSAKNIHRDGVSLDRVGFSGELALDYVGEKLRELRRSSHLFKGQYLGKCGLDLLGGGHRVADE